MNVISFPRAHQFRIENPSPIHTAKKANYSHDDDDNKSHVVTMYATNTILNAFSLEQAPQAIVWTCFMPFGAICPITQTYIL